MKHEKAAWPLHGRVGVAFALWLLLAESALSNLHSTCLLAKLIEIKYSCLLWELLPYQVLFLLSLST